MDQIEKLLLEARSSISDYCINECGAYCCKKGYLILDKNEVEFMIPDKQKFIKSLDLKKLSDNTFSFNLGNKLGHCPQLENNMCLIHKDSRRSKTCLKYPIFLRENKVVHFSSRCYAVKENKFYPYICELIRLGYKIE